MNFKIGFFILSEDCQLSPVEEIVLNRIISALIIQGSNKPLIMPVSTIQKSTGLVKGTVVRAIKHLKELGYILITKMHQYKACYNLYSLPEKMISDVLNGEKRIKIMTRFNTWRDNNSAEINEEEQQLLNQLEDNLQALQRYYQAQEKR